MKINKRILQETISIDALQNETIDIQIPDYARNIVGVLINASSNNEKKHNYISKMSWIKGRFLSLDDIFDMYFDADVANCYYSKQVYSSSPNEVGTIKISALQSLDFFQFLLDYFNDNSNSFGRNYLDKEFDVSHLGISVSENILPHKLYAFLYGKVKVRDVRYDNSFTSFRNGLTNNETTLNFEDDGTGNYLNECRIKTKQFLYKMFFKGLERFYNKYLVKSHILRSMRWDSFCCGTASASFEGSNKLILRDVPVDLNNIRKSIVFDTINVEQTEEPNSFVRFVFKNNRRFNTEIKLNIYLFYI